jgi:CheY-like chemotaxis protein
MPVKAVLQPHPGCAVSERSFPVPVPSASRTILIVEDYKELRSLIGEILKEAGYRVSEAANGAEGLSRLQEQGDISLVITDLAMPGMDGHAFAEQIRAEEIRLARPEIKVIFMSADPEPLLERGEMWGNGIGLLRKPFTDEQLIACVQDTLKPA